MVTCIVRLHRKAVLKKHFEKRPQERTMAAGLKYSWRKTKERYQETAGWKWPAMMS